MEFEQEKPADQQINQTPREMVENVQVEALEEADKRRKQTYYPFNPFKQGALYRVKITEGLDDQTGDRVGMVQESYANYLRELNKYNVSY